MYEMGAILLKLITFAVPCYNSEAYMNHCIDTILEGNLQNDLEILVVDDGSLDTTGAIADRYAAEHPGVVRVIHQQNSGHGEGVNQGMRNAEGLYYKVVDSDDWLDVPALLRVLDKLRQLAASEHPVDMMVCNYVYEHAEDHTRKVIRYTNVFPEGRVFTWREMGHFHPSQFLLMHSVIYRTGLLRDCGLELPKHTFYVDNLFVYHPLPFVRSIYYMNVDLYRYYIGRSDQSVNENVMISRVEQQVRVTHLMIESHDLDTVGRTQKRLARYMFSYLSMMMSISSIFLILTNTPESLGKRTELWEYLRSVNQRVYHRMKYRAVSAFTNFPGYQGRRLSVSLYRFSRRIYKFN